LRATHRSSSADQLLFYNTQLAALYKVNTLLNEQQTTLQKRCVCIKEEAKKKKQLRNDHIRRHYF
jgi:hypothetical protein